MAIDYKYNNFYEIIEANAKNNTNDIAIFNADKKITHTELKKRVDSFARFLSLSGITAHDKVALVLNNSEYFIISLFAITKIGAIAVPVNNFLKNEELLFILGNCDAKLLVSDDSFKKELNGVFENTAIQKIVWTNNKDDLDEKNFAFDEVFTSSTSSVKNSFIPSLDDTAVIVYTSGTTGHPKGAMLSYRNILSNSIDGSKRYNINNKDRFIVYLPMFHSFTLSIMVILPIFNACSIVIVKSIFPFSNVLKQVLLKGVTIFLGAPQIYNALNKAKIPWYFMWFNKIRVFASGSAPLSEQVILDFNKKFKKATMLEGYGLSECSPAVCSNPFDKQKVLSVGLAFDNYEIKIVNDELVEVPRGEIGELIIKGDCVMQGYYKNEEATKETIVNSWLRTGDLAKMDDEDYIYIVDRIKDLIISKGINIYPREIEEQIYMIDGVDAVAVVGIADETKDEKIVAFVQLLEGNTSVDDKIIKAHLKKHIANFKMPKHIYIIDEIPRNATNKVLKRELKLNLNKYIA